MSMPTPSVEYALLSPMLIVFGAAVTGVLVEAFLPRRFRYGAQVALALGGLAAAFVAVVLVGKTIPPTGRTAVLRGLAIDGPTLLLQATIVLVAVMAVIFIAERRSDENATAGPGRSHSRCGRAGLVHPAGLCGTRQRGRASGDPRRGETDRGLPADDARRRRHAGVPGIQRSVDDVRRT